MQVSSHANASVLFCALSPNNHRYALTYRLTVDPYYSLVFRSTAAYAASIENNGDQLEQQELDVEAVEAEKAAAELQYMEDGELVKTAVDLDRVGHHRQLYDRERTRMLTQRMERRLTGEDWGLRTDGTTGLPFWYNTDTGESAWSLPPDAAAASVVAAPPPPSAPVACGGLRRMGRLVVVVE